MLNFIALAFKNVFRNPKRSFTLGANYAIVTLILTLLFAFSRGASTNVSTSIVRASAGQITISGQYALGGKIYNGILRAPDIERLAKDTLGPETTVLPRYLVQSAVYYKGLSKRLGFTGILAERDTGLRDQMLFSTGSWADWAADPSGVVLPEDVATYFGIANGEELVVSTRTRFGAFNTGILKVRGIYSTDNYFMRGLVLVHLPFLRDLDLAAEDSVTTMYLYLGKSTGTSVARDELSTALASAGFEVSRPKSDNEAISAVSAASIKYEADKEGRNRIMLKLSTIDEVLGIVRSIIAAVNAIGALVAGVMLFVIVASIFINLRMSVNERLREIGTMRAIGVGSGGVTALFVLESGVLAAMFSLGGSVIGALLSLLVRATISFPPGGNLAILLSSGHLALEPRLGDMALVILTITLFAAVFSWLPARRGGRISPVDALTKTF
ncbi:MAG: FtsX-like permease family protein [Spirochaetota bacterium]